MLKMKVAIAALTAALSVVGAVVTYELWLGRQSTRDSIEIWQLVGVVASLALIVAIAAWFANGYVAAVVMAVTATYAFSRDAPNRETSAEGVWLLVAALLFAVSLVVLLTVTALVRGVRGRLSGSQTFG